MSTSRYYHFMVSQFNVSRPRSLSTESWNCCETPITIAEIELPHQISELEVFAGPAGL